MFLVELIRHVPQCLPTIEPQLMFLVELICRVPVSTYHWATVRVSGGTDMPCSSVYLPLSHSSCFWWNWYAVFHSVYLPLSHSSFFWWNWYAVFHSVYLPLSHSSCFWWNWYAVFHSVYLPLSHSSCFWWNWYAVFHSVYLPLTPQFMFLVELICRVSVSTYHWATVHVSGGTDMPCSTVSTYHWARVHVSGGTDMPCSTVSTYHWATVHVSGGTDMPCSTVSTYHWATVHVSGGTDMPCSSVYLPLSHSSCFWWNWYAVFQSLPTIEPQFMFLVELICRVPVSTYHWATVHVSGGTDMPCSSVYLPLSHSSCFWWNWYAVFHSVYLPLSHSSCFWWN